MLLLCRNQRRPNLHHHQINIKININKHIDALDALDQYHYYHWEQYTHALWLPNSISNTLSFASRQHDDQALFDPLAHLFL